MLQRRIKVLQLITTFAKGGPGHVVETLVKNIDQSKFEITCCSMYSPPKERDIVLPAELGVKHICLQMKHFLEPSVLLKLNALIKNGKFDIIHTYLTRADWYGRVVACWRGIPVVSTILGQDRFFNYIDFGPIKGRIIATITRGTMQFVNTFIAISNGVKEYLVCSEGISEKRIEVIYIGIELDTFDTSTIDAHISRQKFGITDDTLVVGSVAVLHPRKGLNYLIRSARKVVDSMPNVKFFIWGKGPEETNLKKLIAQLRLQDHVIFCGETYPSIIPIIMVMDVFCLPSLFDGLGIAVLEAQSLKKPCIVTDIPGLRETIIKDKTGLIIPPKNENALIEAILTLLSDKERCSSMGEAGRKYIMENFSAHQMARRHEEVYREIIST